jgi:hypothetical protein
MEFQQDFLGRDKGDRKWVSVMARVSEEEKRDIFLYCRSVGLNYSVLTRIIWKKVLCNLRTMPQVRPDPAKEIDLALRDVVSYIPVVVKQREFNPRLY